MAEIIVSGVRKSFVQERVVLDDVSFSIDRGERVGLLGGNGSGKTTLLKIIMGELAPDAGSVSVTGGRKVGYVAQLNRASGDELVEEVLKGAYADVFALSSAMEALYPRLGSDRAADDEYSALLARFEAAGGYDWETDLNKVANGLNIDAGMRARRFGELSGGEQTRVCLAKLIMQRTDVLLLDEPTNHLDIASLEWLEEYLLHYKGTVLAVSHDRYFLDAVVGRIIELEHGRPSFYGGNYSYYVVEKELRYQQQLEQYKREQAKINQLEFTIARFKAWGSVYDNPALHKKAAAMERRVERIRQTDRPTKEQAMRAGFAGENFSADWVLSIKNLSKSFDDKRLFEGLEAQIRGGGERVALLGGNGSGKTTLLKILLGQESADSGTVRFGPSVKAAYLPQNVVFAHPERTLHDTLLYELNYLPQQARDRLAAFKFKGEDVFKTVSQLSGGERARLRLCIIMAGKANLLILDEPTNHLDLASREWIEEAVDGFEGTLLFVSHDRYFINRFARRVWELDEGRFADYPGDYAHYRSAKSMETIAQSRAKQPAQAQKRAPELDKADDAKTARRRTALEGDIARAERELDELCRQMDACADDYAQWMTLSDEKSARESALSELYRQWEELDEA